MNCRRSWTAGTVSVRHRFSPASFRRADHLGDPNRPLADAVADLVEERTGRRPAGPVRLLTLLRNWGYYFSPLNLYYCFDRAGQTVDTRRGRGQQHALARAALVRARRRQPHRASQRSCGSVTPRIFTSRHFLDMDLQYEWHLQEPGEQLRVAIINSRGDERVFDVSMVLKRRELTRGAMLRTLVRYPWMTGRVVQAIYWQAFWLWWKKCPFYASSEVVPRPGNRQT